jgi:hypothetical protein
MICIALYLCPYLYQSIIAFTLTPLFDAVHGTAAAATAKA